MLNLGTMTDAEIWLGQNAPQGKWYSTNSRHQLYCVIPGLSPDFMDMTYAVLFKYSSNIDIIINIMDIISLQANLGGENKKFVGHSFDIDFRMAASQVDFSIPNVNFDSYLQLWTIFMLNLGTMTDAEIWLGQNAPQGKWYSTNSRHQLYCVIPGLSPDFKDMTSAVLLKYSSNIEKKHKINRFTTDFHSKSSISETKGRRVVKVYIFWTLFSRPIQNLMFVECCC